MVVFRGEVDCPEELNEYEGFEIIYRNAVQVACIVNVTMENMTPEDVYQVVILYLLCLVNDEQIVCWKHCMTFCFIL